MRYCEIAVPSHSDTINNSSESVNNSSESVPSHSDTINNASKPISAAKDCIDIPMSEMPELSLAHAFVTKSQRHVEFATNSYVQPPRSKFGKK